MRIAVCLSGQPRFLSLCLPGIKKYLVETNQADVFVHTWWNPSDVGRFHDTSIPYQFATVGSVESDVSEKLQSLSPVKMEIDLPKEFELASRLRYASTARPNSLCSNFYSQHRAIKLKAEYEKEEGFVYDAVIRARLDLAYEGPVCVSEITHDLREYLVLASIWQDKRQAMIPGLGDYTMDDNIVISSSPNINKYGETYQRMQEINDVINPPFAENYLGWNCKKINHLKVETWNFPVEIMQRVINNNRSVR